MTTTNDPTAVAAELRKQAQLKREVAARTLDRCRNLSLPADLRGAEESDARDDLRTAGEYDRLASVLEAAAAREAALNARIRELEAERDELFGLFDRDQAAAPVQPRPPGWKASGLWEFAMLERRKRIKATKALREASELLANPGVWTPPVADALAIINTALRALAEEGRE